MQVSRVHTSTGRKPTQENARCAGAELQAVIRKATNWALEEVLDKSKLSTVSKDLHPVVAMRHFRQVLDHEIKPAFGAAHDTIASYYARGMFNFGPRFMRIMEDVPDACELTADDPKRTILLTGALFFCLGALCLGALLPDASEESKARMRKIHE